jgi:protein involved in polysaccharide export with SLBB domain
MIVGNLARQAAAVPGSFMAAASPSAVVGFLLVIFLSVVFAAAQSPTPSPVQPDTLESDLIHYGDLIDVDVVGSLDGDWRGSVNPEGFLQGLIYAPEPIYALCKSEHAVASEITTQYARTLKDPKVVVRVLDRSGRAVTLMLGAVRNQQRFKLKRETRLNELLALSGGITDTASGDITIARPADLNCFPSAEKENGKLALMRLTIRQVLSGDPDANPVILSGDIITVVEASPIYIIGGVNNPRQISSREEMTLSRAISSAGGLAKEAVENDITVYRREGKEGKSISVDLKRIRSKQQDDLVLKPFDIVDIGQKGRAKPKFPPTVNVDARSRDIYKLPVRVVE